MITDAQSSMLKSAVGNSSVADLSLTAGNHTTNLISWSSLTTSHSAPVYYDAVYNRVVVQGNGTILSGYDFRGTTVDIKADNVTIKNSTFDAAAGYYAINQENGHTGMVVDHNTFNGGVDRNYSDFVRGGTGSATLTNNAFLNAPSDAVSIQNGTVSGNYFAGAGFLSGAHADAIWVTATTGAVNIANNLIDWTATAGAKVATNDAIRITTELGSVSNVTVNNNILLGGTYAIDAGNAGTNGTYSNVNIANNTIGFTTFGAFYSSTTPNVTTSGNKVIDYTNRGYSDAAWDSYALSQIHTDHLVVEPSTGGNLAAATSGTTTEYGGGSTEWIYGGSNVTVLVGGYGVQYFRGGTGTNIYTYLSIADSTPTNRDVIANFNDAKDKIDLHLIDADPTKAGLQTFHFIGNQAFSSAGDEIRVTQDAVKNMTFVDATLAGDSKADLHIELSGLHNLTASSFSLVDTAVYGDTAVNVTKGDGALLVAGNGSDILTVGANATVIAGNGNNTVTTGANSTITVGNGNDIVRAGAGSTITLGGGTDTVIANNVTVNAGTGVDTFVFNGLFGVNTINNFNAAKDVIQVDHSLFANFAAVQAHMQQVGSDTVIAFDAHNSISLHNVNVASIHASDFHFA